MHFDKMSIVLSIMYFKGSQVEIFKLYMMYFCHEDLILSLQTVQTLMKCMCIVVAFHEGLHRLPKNLFADHVSRMRG